MFNREKIKVIERFLTITLTFCSTISLIYFGNCGPFWELGWKNITLLFLQVSFVLLK